MDGNRVVTLAKHNWGPPQESRSFRTEEVTLPDGIEAIRLEWEDETPAYEVDDILAGKHLKNEESKFTIARDLIEKMLLDGPRLKSEIVAAAANLGIGEKTVEKAWAPSRAVTLRYHQVVTPRGASLPGTRLNAEPGEYRHHQGALPLSVYR